MSKTESIVLGGGCFWCLEAAYQQIKGVTEVVPGYAGGTDPNPTYEAVCTGMTGHAEVVRVTFEPDVIRLADVLAIFWLVHDPTSRDRQGADVGSQYASVMFYENEQQHQQLLESRRGAQELVDAQIVTRIEELVTFYEAEPEHHNYFETHSTAAYCQVVIEPKLEKLREHFSGLLKPL